MAFVFEHIHFHILDVADEEKVFVQFKFKLHVHLDGHIDRLVNTVDGIHHSDTQRRVDGCQTVFDVEGRRLKLTLGVFTTASINLHPHLSLAINLLPVGENGFDGGRGYEAPHFQFFILKKS